ncbi:MAG: hypothetical protein QOK23_1571 [Gammaproteobacteria bacterium]|jgi:hypothetical protein|nr:hypothetical protein [Gammaproteobacteria bacterium]
MGESLSFSASEVDRNTRPSARHGADPDMVTSHARTRMRRLLKRHFGEWICTDILIERMMEYM